MIHSLNKITDPQKILHAYQHQLPCCLTFSFLHQQLYLSSNDTIELIAICLINQSGTHCLIKASHDAPSLVALDKNLVPEDYFKQVQKLWSCQGVDLDSPWHLETIRIPKPWGAEIWYTGMEDRGICTVGDIPLPWLLALSPLPLLPLSSPPLPGLQKANAVENSTNVNIILLKILDPLPEPDIGDLYFELHQKKIEVYIVTAIDQSIWPDGEGKIRYGFCQDKIKSYQTIAEFKEAYLKAVKAYQAVRDEIDALPKTEPCPQEWVKKEAQLKNRMYEFTTLKTLKLGDVVHIHPYFPHSLQHGVRVIEFQTAHYERSILSFTQKVLTQSHWDTQSAMEHVQTASPKDVDFEILEEDKDLLLEVIADFDQFTALRLSMRKTTESNAASYSTKIKNYALIIGIAGEGTLEDSQGNTIKIMPEESFLLTSRSGDIKITGKDIVILLALPK